MMTSSSPNKVIAIIWITIAVVGSSAYPDQIHLEVHLKTSAMKVFVLLACLLVAVYASTIRPELRQWMQYKAKHGKRYDNDKEDAHRMKIFLENKAFVEAHNKRYQNGHVNFTVTLNRFADLTTEEFAETYANSRPALMEHRATKMHKAMPGNSPASIDWRSKGAVTSVKSQNKCNAGWAFSVVGAIEGSHAIASGALWAASAQQLIDCDTSDYGCEGGNMTTAFEYVIDYGGIDYDITYPYVAKAGQCKSSKDYIVASISSYSIIPTADESALTDAIAYIGPISAGIDASQQSFQLYSGGIYSDPACSSTVLNHGVLAVGYDSQEGQDYYIVKNSWSTDWGIDGYVYMSRNNANNCGIATAASYPLSEDKKKRQIN